jgi:outer membrane lipoprotein-sorting protein
MTRFLRSVSTRRLLATIAGVVVVIGAGTAIAVAAAGSGPVPARKPLAQALHDAASAPAVNGITARITFSNHLIDASNIQGSDPLLTGASGRLWLSSDHRLRLELQSDNGDAQAVVSNGSFWVYDPSSNTVYEGAVPAQHTTAKDHSSTHALPSMADIQRELNRLASHLDISGATPGDVAARPAYTVRVSPKHDGGLLGAAEVAWDAVRGIPLRFAVYARNQSSPVLELRATDISYGPVPASTFAVSPPSGAKVVKVASPSAGEVRKHIKHAKGAEATGAAAVARHLPFKLNAPSSLVGLTRRSVTLLDWQGSPAALVTYGQNLGGIAVIEQAAPPGSAQTQTQNGDHAGLSLPTISINGASGQELDTALGTMVRFTRSGVSYMVLGSVPPAAAQLAARAL